MLRARADHAQVLVDAERREEPAALRHVADAAGGDLVRGLAEQLVALEADRPGRRGGVMPMIELHSVVLPMPLRPMIATDSLPISNETSSSARALPVERVQVVTAKNGVSRRLAHVVAAPCEVPR